MNRSCRSPCCLWFAWLLVFVGDVAAQKATPLAAQAHDRSSLEALLNSTVAATLEQFRADKLQSNQLAVTLVDLSDEAHPQQASYRGDVPIYPASVVKLFYLVAAHQWMEEGRLQETEELRRALHDMIVDSSNDATHYVVDLLTGTTSGPELPETELEQWMEKRNAVNRYFFSLGYTNINANRKPWCEGPYGREMQSVKKHRPNRNLLTTDATARMVTEIVTGRAVTPARAAAMKALMKRDPFTKPAASCDPDQGYDFSGPALPPGARLWSKAGWTSQTRHDAAYIELPNGARFVLVTFTTDHANERAIIPRIAQRIIERWTPK